MGERYLIPRRITQRWELVPGWGKPELLICLTGAAGSAGLVGISSLIGLPIYVVALLGLLPLGVAVLLVMPQPTGGCFVDMLLAQRAYMATRKLYLFDFGRDDT